MSSSSIIRAQGLLYSWISSYEKRSYALIRNACTELTSLMNLDLGKYPIRELFYPLLYSGVVDHIGNDYYSLTKPVAISFDGFSYLINCISVPNTGEKLPIGYSETLSISIPDNLDVLHMNSISILKSFPKISSVVESWPSSILDDEKLVYHDSMKKIGVADYDNGQTRFFSIPSKNFLKEIPPRFLNPDSYHIGICYERSINNKGNGFYIKHSKELFIKKFGMPILLYRALSIDGMAVKLFPSVVDDYYKFNNISPAVVKEVNRILCKSITYE